MEPQQGPNGPRLYMRLFLASLITLWVVDVLAGLQLVRKLFLGPRELGRIGDFVGLAVAETQIALGVGLAALLLGAVVARLLPGSRRGRESVAFLAAITAGLYVLARTPQWSFALSSGTSKIAFAAAFGLGTWVVVRWLVRAVRGGTWGVSDAVKWTLTPALVVAFAVDSLRAGLQDLPVEAAVPGLAACVVVALGALSLRARPLRGFAGSHWLLVVAALLVSGHAVVSFHTAGAFDYDDVPDGSAGSRPNIVLIVMDTVRADHLGRYGYSRDTMPGLEAWARGGVTAMRAISPGGWTTPAHASILSGETVSGHGIHYVSGAGKHHSLRTHAFEGISWLPEALSEEGYYCLAVSANPLAVVGDIEGFDRVVVPEHRAWRSSTLASRVDELSPLLGAVSERLRWRMQYVDASGIVDIAKRAVPHDDRPLFLFVNFLDAHSPYNPPTSALEELGLSPGRLFSRYDMHTEITLGWGSLPDGKSQYVADLYDGELRWVDTNLERLLVWVDERYGSDAVVIVTSDHGEELGEQGRVGHLYGLPQSIIHVPLFIRAPGLARGELRECVTIQSLFGFIRSCAAGDSPSLDRLLDAGPYGLISERYPSEANARVFGREYDRSWVSLIDGGYKAVGPSEAGFELLDIESSGFNRALSVSDSAAGRALQTRIDSYWEECRDTRSDDDRPLSASEERALRSLGYLH